MFLILINGMFAYIVYDKKLRKLFFSTDPQGEKDYINMRTKLFILSSTIKSIKEYLGECKFNINSFRDYFSTRHFLMNDKNYL